MRRKKSMSQHFQYVAEIMVTWPGYFLGGFFVVGGYNSLLNKENLDIVYLPMTITNSVEVMLNSIYVM